MREYDDLPVACYLAEQPGKPVDLRRVHRLNRVVDHDEPERALGCRRAGDEQSETKSVQLALAHDAQRGARYTVHCHIETELALSRGADKADRPEVHVAL